MPQTCVLCKHARGKDRVLSDGFIMAPSCHRHRPVPGHPQRPAACLRSKTAKAGAQNSGLCEAYLKKNLEFVKIAYGCTLLSNSIPTDFYFLEKTGISVKCFMQTIKLCFLFCITKHLCVELSTWSWSTFRGDVRSSGPT